MSSTPVLRRLALGAVAVLLAGVVGGCGAANSAPGTGSSSGVATPGPSASGGPGESGGSVPSGARTLADLGFSHAPELSVWVPEGASVAQRIDQPNVVTLVFSAPRGAELAAFYRQTLPAGGWVVTADANDSLVFQAPGWEGAFTASTQVSGLTLRRV